MEIAQNLKADMNNTNCLRFSFRGGDWFMEDVKIRLAVLWLFVAINMSALVMVIFMVPGMIEEIMAGEILGMQIGPAELFIMAFTYFWVPSVMAVMSCTLKDKACRWTNIIIGIVYTAFVLMELLLNLTQVAYPFAVFLDVSAILASVLIFWYAYKWK